MQGFAVFAAGGGGLPAVSPGSQGEAAVCLSVMLYAMHLFMVLNEDILHQVIRYNVSA